MATYPPSVPGPNHELSATAVVAGPARDDPAVASARQQRLAWTVLWLAFGCFLLLLTGAGVLALHVMATATDAEDARVTTISGTVLLRQPRQTLWVSAGPQAPLSEGYKLRTDGVSQAFVSLFDHSTLQVYSGTELELTQHATKRFDPAQAILVLTLSQGKLHVGVAPVAGSRRSLRMVTPYGSMDLSEGSYTVTVDATATKVRVAERGEARLVSAHGGITIHDGEHADMGPAGFTPPTLAPEELVYNGDFTQGLDGWRTGNVAGFREGSDVPGIQELISDEGRLASHFVRKGSRGTHSETFVYQDLDKDLSDYKDLRLSLDLRIKNQNLSGGGYLGTEYPVLVRLTYRSSGNETSAAWGFYYANPDNNRTDVGVQVPQDTWTHFASPFNLMALSPPPQRLLSVQVSGSGWDYDSLATNISVTVQ